MFCARFLLFIKALFLKIFKQYYLSFPLNIFCGCFFFALGKYIAENEEELKKKFTRKNCIFLLIISYLFYLGEVFFVRYCKIQYTTDIAFGLIPTSFFLLLLCLMCNIRICHNLLMRKISIIIYCSQANILFLRLFCLDDLGISNTLIKNLFSIGMLICIIVLVLYLQKHTKWKWVHYLT